MARPEWVTYSDEEIEEMILKFNREGKSTSQIGILLRDQYGIPSVKDVTGERITEILIRNNQDRLLKFFCLRLGFPLPSWLH